MPSTSSATTSSNFHSLIVPINGVVIKSRYNSDVHFNGTLEAGKTLTLKDVPLCITNLDSAYDLKIDKANELGDNPYWTIRELKDSEKIKNGYGIEVYDISYAEEAGIKSATFAVRIPYAYGTLSVEQGTHRLVRISPFDNQGRRQTSFAGVEVLPVVAETDHIEIPETDIRVDVFPIASPHRGTGISGDGLRDRKSVV